MSLLKVSDLIADFLKEKGIRRVFGIIGSGNAHIFDSIYNLGFTEIVCVHHEQAAVMAMQTYFRSSGEISACILTTGAGSTNGVTGVVSAWMDSVPGVIISGNENSKFTLDSNHLRIWGIQGYDSTAMVSKVTKYSKRVLEGKDIVHELNEAYHLASTGRPGPVWLDVPMNIQAASVEAQSLTPWKTPAPLKPRVSARCSTDVQKSVDQILEQLKSAQRPVLWLGHGIRLAKGADLVLPLIEKLKIPTLVSWAGIDMVDSNHPLVYGRAGIYGQRAANFVLQNSDFLLTIGTRLAMPQIGYELSELTRKAKIAVVDIDALEVEKLGEKIDFPVCADAKIFIDTVLTEAKNSDIHFERPEWIKRCNTYREKYPWIGPEHADTTGFINSYPFMKKLESFFKPKQVVVTDMGTALLSGHQVLSFKPGQRFMTSTGLGEMGYGLPAAIGASFGTDKGEVLCLNCDGGMMMNLQELQTIVHHKLPIKIIIFNNDGYLMIKHTQKALFKGRYSGTDAKSGVTCPDYSKIATAFEIPSYQIRTWDDVASILPKVQAHNGPVICEVFMHPEQLFLSKLSLAPQKDGSIVSPPLEDLSPIISRAEMRENMVIGLHPKSESL
jgi:acetolactate synthase-1/2/3 large subunit